MDLLLFVFGIICFNAFAITTTRPLHFRQAGRPLCFFRFSTAQGTMSVVAKAVVTMDASRKLARSVEASNQ